MPDTGRPQARPDLPAAVTELLGELGVDSSRVREILCRLADGGPGWTIPALVAATATSRRTVEAVLRAAAEHLEDGEGAGRRRVTAGHAAAYRDVLGCDRVDAGGRLADPVAHLVPAHSGVLAELRALVDAAPRPRKALDHVAATPETALRRALYLGARFWLDGATLLCVGDHDLTSLATALVHRGTRVVVVDVDERICEYIDREAARRRLPVQVRYGDLRLGLPPSAAGTADLVFTDPPYTPEGVRLFLTRGLEGLRDRVHGRLLMAYGYGEMLPALGAKVQAVVGDLQLALEAVLPGFNAYTGAEAIGGVSDLYVCRPTARTWTLLAAQARRTSAAERPAANIYSQGTHAVEAAGTAGAALDADSAAAVLDRHRPDLLVGGWRDAAGPGVPRTGLAAWLAAPPKPGSGPRSRATGAAVAVNLTGGYEPALLRVLLAASADRLAVVVDNSTDAVRTADGQRELAMLLAPSYRLRFLRSTPGPRLAVVTAERVPDPAAGADAVLRWVQDRPHGTVANGWREGLIALSRRAGGPVLTKNAARALIAAADPALAAGGADADASLLELPRHRLHDLTAAVTASVARLASGADASEVRP